MNESMNVWMNEWNESMKWPDECMNTWIQWMKQRKEWTWMKEWMNEWMNEWMVG